MGRFGFGRMSVVTHGMQGWWWARRHGYPGDEHGVGVPVYGWVDAEAVEPAKAVERATVQAVLPAPLADPAPTIQSIDSDDRIAAFPIRA